MSLFKFSIPTIGFPNVAENSLSEGWNPATEESVFLTDRGGWAGAGQAATMVSKGQVGDRLPASNTKMPIKETPLHRRLLTEGK